MYEKWIQGAIKHPGALTKTAKKKGLVKKGEKLSSSDLSELKKSKNYKTKRRAILAQTLRKMRSKKG